MVAILEASRIARAKQAFSTRRVPRNKLRAIFASPRKPQPGDLVLARVVSVGRLKRLELTTGRKAELYVGDEVIVAYGNRYAPDAYEAEVPLHMGECDLAAAGGIASTVLNTSGVFASQGGKPTRLEPIGIFARTQDTALNLNDFALPKNEEITTRVPIIAVVGASMNSGKTTTVAGMIKGLSAQGMRVGAAKITGTGSGNDLWKFSDAGAASFCDFTDAGMATTYLEPIERITAGAQHLVRHLLNEGCNAIVLEIADGVHQRETKALINHPVLSALVDHWVFAADSAASAKVGVDIMGDLGRDVLAVSGLVTASPLAVREMQHLITCDVLDLPALQKGTALQNVITQTRAATHPAAAAMTDQLSA